MNDMKYILFLETLYLLTYSNLKIMYRNLLLTHFLIFIKTNQLIYYKNEVNKFN